MLLVGPGSLGRWTVLVLELPDGGVGLIGGALHLHEVFVLPARTRPGPTRRLCDAGVMPGLYSVG
ncbi:hypothetical protein ADK65_29405 [Streptomyces sp. NRRL B-1140]|uniref:hypothetical protein n=1 Tax=Streptomyces sp. NRRL B-1140 TaxID=1415549 RepID=UPI0006B00771|nr:hypothetical protein [Streptomyces sp. NRRL B-1140]KOV95838.1 hypothetical protein ADK65_29405 [Streptomyces sp. NRRL B-1140]